MFRKLLPLVLLVFVTACTPQSQGTPCHCKQSGVCHCMKSGECPCAKAGNCGCHKAEGMACGCHEGTGNSCQCGEQCGCPMCHKHKDGAHAGDHHGSVPMHEGMTCHKNKAAKTR